MDKNPPANAGDLGSIPGARRLYVLRSSYAFTRNYWGRLQTHDLASPEPVRHSYWSPSTWSLHCTQENHDDQEAHAPVMSSPHAPQLEKACAEQRSKAEDIWLLKRDTPPFIPMTRFLGFWSLYVGKVNNWDFDRKQKFPLAGCQNSVLIFMCKW